MSVLSNETVQILSNKLKCRCASSGFKYVDKGFVCDACKTTIYYENNVFRTIDLNEAINPLEDLEYDLRHNTDNQTGINLANRYLKYAVQDRDNLDVLEIGCGTGNLTLGLSENPQIEYCTAVDIAYSFLQTNRKKLDMYSSGAEKVTLMCANVEELPFDDNSFDAIIGNSFLHHIYDYADLLKRLHRILKPGGSVVFSEPCQQGKSLIAFFLSIMIRQDKTLGKKDKVFTSQDVEVIENGIHVLTREQYVDKIGRPEIKKDMEDKHIFDSDDIMRLSSEIGFSECRLLNTGTPANGYRHFVINTLNMLKIDKDISRYDYLFEEFQDKYLYFMADKTETPHRFFVFKK